MMSFYDTDPDECCGRRKDITMIFKNTHELADFINQHHYSFAGHRISFGCANINTFDTIMRAIDYLKREKSARSADFDAAFMDLGTIIRTTITIGLDDNGITYTERIK